MLASVISWFTPGSFLLIAVVILTIYLFTPSSQPHYHQTIPEYGARHLARPPSFLQRVKSFDFSSHNNYNYPNRDAYVGLNNDAFGNPADQYPAVQPPVLERAPSTRVESISLNPYKSIPTNTESDYVSYPNPRYEAPGSGFQEAARVPSFSDRIKSFNFTSIPRSDSTNENRESEFLPEPGTTREPGRVNRSASESSAIQRKLPGKMKKSGSENLGDREDAEEVERRRPVSARFERTVSIGESGDVDAKADSFIRNFRMQRLESFRRYKEKIMSFNFTRSDSIQENRDPDSTPEQDPTRPGRVNRSATDGLVIRSKLPEKLKKSGSENLRDREDVEEVERRRPQSARIEGTASIWEIRDVDAEADNFIKKFRMQRLESLRRCKEMLKGKVM